MLTKMCFCSLLSECQAKFEQIILFKNFKLSDYVLHKQNTLKPSNFFTPPLPNNNNNNVALVNTMSTP